MIRYKTHNTPEQLGSLTDYTLESAGVTEKDLRKLVLAAVRKAGYKQKPSAVASSSRSVPSTSKSASKPQACSASCASGGSVNLRPCRRRGNGNETTTSTNCCQTGRLRKATPMAVLTFTRFSMKRCVRLVGRGLRPGHRRCAPRSRALFMSPPVYTMSPRAGSRPSMLLTTYRVSCRRSNPSTQC